MIKFRKNIVKSDKTVKRETVFLAIRFFVGAIPPLIAP